MKNADSPATPTLKIEEYKCSEGLPVGCFQTKQRTVNHTGLTKARDVRNACAERYTRMV